jgi:hypothetical protein
MAIMGSFASAAAVPFGSVTVTGNGDNVAGTSDGVKEDSVNPLSDWDQGLANRVNGSAMTLTFNLGASHTLSGIDVSYVVATNAGVSKPSSVSLWYSSDGNFNTTADQVFDSGSSSAWNDSPTGWTTFVDQPIAVSATAQYVKIQFPNGQGGWVAGITEVQFDTGGGTAVPEPASLGLLSLGGLALMRRRRQA